MAENIPVAYLNGNFVPSAECRLPVYDLGIVMGAAVTDFVRTVNGRLYLLERHVRRFYRSCRYAHIQPSVPPKESMRIAEELIERNKRLYGDRSELGLVFYMTAGENPLYAGSAGLDVEPSPTYVQHIFPLPFALWRNGFLKGINCVTPSVRHLHPSCLSSKIKHRNRLHMWIGEQEARLIDQAAVALYLDMNGNLTETGGSNFVIYRGGKVVSPRRTNILWGESLQALSEILEQMGIPFLEEDIQVYDALNAEEAWLPTTPYFLGPVVRLNGVPIGVGKPGAVWRKVLHRWSTEIGKDIYMEIAGAANDLQ